MTKLNKIPLGRQLRQDAKILRFRKSQFLINSTPKLGIESVPETENFYAMLRLSAQEDFIEKFFYFSKLRLACLSTNLPFG
jgi:hypothetical protein